MFELLYILSVSLLVLVTIIGIDRIIEAVQRFRKSWKLTGKEERDGK
jgi:hypothetical protein